MNRYGVGAERVQDDQIVRPGRCALKSHTPVAEDDVQTTLAVLKVREVAWIARDTLHEWIDLVERPVLTWFRIARQRAAAEPHHCDAFEIARGKQLSDWVGRMIVT